MNEPGGAPWSDGAGTMRAGPPPAGWWRASDGCWYPPDPSGGTRRRPRHDDQPDGGPGYRPTIDGLNNGTGHSSGNGHGDRRPGGSVPPVAVVDYRSAYGDLSADRRRGGAYREPTPHEVVATLRSGEHRAVAGPPPPPTPSGEHRVTRAPMSGLVDSYRSWPRWGRLLAPVAGVAVVLGAMGAFTGEPPEDHEAIATQNTAPPPTEASTTTTAVAAIPPPPPPPSVPIVTAPPPPPAVDPTPVTDPASDLDAQPRVDAAEAPDHVHFDSCDAARAAGAAPVRVGDPGYGTHLDRDRDGVACE